MGLNEDLVNQVQGGNVALMGKLWENNKKLIAYIAGRYQYGCGQLCDAEDLLQAGYLGLHAAAMKYSPERGATFSSYAVLHICTSMREVVGLRGKHDPIIGAVSLDCPLGDDGEDTLYKLIPAESEDCSVELGNLVTIVRTAVAQMKNGEAREAIRSVYFDGMRVVDYAASEGISRQAAHGRLQKGYDILRKDKAIINLAIAEGYSICRHSSNDLYSFRGKAESSVEAAVIRKDEAEQRQKALRKHLGNLIDIHIPGQLNDMT